MAAFPTLLFFTVKAVKNLFKNFKILKKEYKI